MHHTALDTSLWKGNEAHKRSKIPMVDWIRRKLASRNAGAVERGAKHYVKITNRMTGWKDLKMNWAANPWTAVPKLFLYYLNPMHCVGFGNLVNKIRMGGLFLFNKAEWRKQKLLCVV